MIWGTKMLILKAQVPNQRQEGPREVNKKENTEKLLIRET